MASREVGDPNEAAHEVISRRANVRERLNACRIRLKQVDADLAAAQSSLAKTIDEFVAHLEQKKEVLRKRDDVLQDVAEFGTRQVSEIIRGAWGPDLISLGKQLRENLKRLEYVERMPTHEGFWAGVWGSARRVVSSSLAEKDVKRSASTLAEEAWKLWRSQPLVFKDEAADLFRMLDNLEVALSRLDADLEKLNARQTDVEGQVVHLKHVRDEASREQKQAEDQCWGLGRLQ